ncbi:MAG: MBL fold metallo-hydrolase [Deltaproteobacteria bacterium]
MNHEKSYDRPIEIAENIYWVGFHEKTSNFHCNPYLIVEGDRAVLIDAGSRPDFAVVMMKILQTGISPEQIVALIYHHVDPDLCGSLSNMIDICANPELIVLSEPQNNIFISYYIEREKRGLLTSIDDYGSGFTFGERTLKFVKTPYAHDAGSFVTHDMKTGTLFSSDLFGSFSSQWELFVELADDCYTCRDYDNCIKQRKYCPLPDILEFHKTIMPSEKALKYAMDVIGGLDVQMIAPQHGSVFARKKDIDFLIERLGALKGVGIDGIS